MQAPPLLLVRELWITHIAHIMFPELSMRSQ